MPTILDILELPAVHIKGPTSFQVEFYVVNESMEDSVSGQSLMLKGQSYI